MIRRLRNRVLYLRWLARLSAQAGRQDQRGILDTSSRLLEIEPDDALVLSLRADALETERRHDEALELRMRAVHLEPTGFGYLKEAATAHLQVGDVDRAYPLVRRALEHAPRCPEPVGRVELGVARAIGLLKRDGGRVEACRRQHEDRERHLQEWLRWAEDFAAWYESVHPPPEETVH